MRNRLQEFSLTLHPAKTRLIEFGRHVEARRAKAGLGKPESLQFPRVHLHLRPVNARVLIHRRTRRDRVRAKLKAIKEELRGADAPADPRTGIAVKWCARSFSVAGSVLI